MFKLRKGAPILSTSGEVIGIAVAIHEEAPLMFTKIKYFYESFILPEILQRAQQDEEFPRSSSASFMGDLYSNNENDMIISKSLLKKKTKKNWSLKKLRFFPKS